MWESRCVIREQGLPAEIIDTLFTPFVTTKSHGLGIGLSIAKEDRRGSRRDDRCPAKMRTVVRLSPSRCRATRPRATRARPLTKAIMLTDARDALPQRSGAVGARRPRPGKVRTPLSRLAGARSSGRWASKVRHLIEANGRRIEELSRRKPARCRTSEVRSRA